ncbi:MAG: hypothetical protein PUA86_05120 [Clostridiaceae bacterium]|nr:hypothetical protein [Clostridiaceae bacterium]
MIKQAKSRAGCLQTARSGFPGVSGRNFTVRRQTEQKCLLTTIHHKKRKVKPFSERNLKNEKDCRRKETLPLVSCAAAVSNSRNPQKNGEVGDRIPANPTEKPEKTGIYAPAGKPDGRLSRICIKLRQVLKVDLVTATKLRTSCIFLLTNAREHVYNTRMKKSKCVLRKTRVRFALFSFVTTWTTEGSGKYGEIFKGRYHTSGEGTGYRIHQNAVYRHIRTAEKRGDHEIAD